MGLLDRHYHHAGRDEPPDDDDDSRGPSIPLWEQLADRLRVRLNDILENKTDIDTVEFATLVNAATALQTFHLRGQQMDAADEKDED